MLFAELMFAILGLFELALIAFVAVFEFVFALGFALLEAAGLALNSRSATVSDSARDSSGSRSSSWLVKLARSKWFKRVGVAGCSFLFLTLLAAICLNVFFFEGTVRWVLARAESHNGVHIEFGAAEGNLFTGRASLTNVKISRSRHPTTLFELNAKSFRLDIDIPSLIFGPRAIESAGLEGVSGQVTRVGKADRRTRFGREGLVIKALTLRDANLTWVDTTKESQPKHLTIVVDQLESRNLRSNWIAFDLLFKTNAGGAIAGAPFSVSHNVNGDAHAVRWRFERLPALVFGDVVGGPFKWLTEGGATIVAFTSWRSDMKPDLNMQWSVELIDVHAEAPAGLGDWSRRASQAFVDYLNRRDDPISLEFSLDFDASGFEGAASADAAGLWESVAKAAMQTLSEKLELPLTKVEDWKESAGEHLRRFRRDPKSPKDESE